MAGILLIGGSGYIGSMVGTHLRKAGHAVTVLDHHGQGGPWYAGEHCVRGDYRQHATAEFVARFDWVVHLAGHSSVGMCRHEPVASYHNNVAGFVDLLQACRGTPLIYASSVSVYGDTGTCEAGEDMPLPAPKNHYDAGKQDLDRYAALVSQDTWGLRFGTVCGWSENLREDLLLNCMVMTGVRERAVRLANPRTNRPILGINDLCRAVAWIVDGKAKPGVYNLLTANTTMEEIAEEVSRALKVPIKRAEMANAYDIRATASKFMAQGGFEFKDWVPDLIRDVYYAYERCVRIARRDGGWISSML